MPLSFFTNSGSSYGSSVPFQRIVEPAQLGVFLNLEQAELLRIQRYNESWRFYYGKHWGFTREDGEPLVTFNYYRKFIDKHAEFLVSKGFVNNVPEPLEEVTKPYLDEVWDYNDRERLLWDIATTGGVTGDVFTLVTDEEPTLLQKKINPASEGRTRINLLGSEQVFPTWDPLNHQTLTGVRIETVYYADRGVHQMDRDDKANHEGRQLYTKRFTQIITPDHIVEQFHGQPPIVKPNSLGEIPLIHWPNISIPKEYYGLSDGQDLIDMNREFNEKSTDISDTINYHSAPTTVITGAKAKQLEKGNHQIWSGLPADANVFNLKLDGDLTAAQSYKGDVKKSMHEIGDIPEGCLGEMQPISNTSGVALHMMYQPIIGRRRRKQATYEAGIERINYFILRIGMITGRVNLPFDICANCGGRIVEIETGKKSKKWNPEAQKFDDVPQRMKRCFHINKQTLDFELPEDMRIKVWRDYGFGGSTKEVPLSEAKDIAAGAKSYWDYAYVNLEEFDEWQTSISDIRKRNQDKASEEAAKPPPKPVPTAPLSEGGPPGPPEPPPPPTMEPEPPPPMPKVKRLPIGDVNPPEEPETINLVQPLLHPVTQVPVDFIRETREVVPTGCHSPRYLNPFKTEPVFADVLPKDEALQSQLYSGYQQAGWVDKEWCQDRIPEIAQDKNEINKRLKSVQTSGLPQPMTSALVPGAPQAPPVTELAPAAAPMASVPGPGGNPVAPGSEG